jgi:GIY-YIG catalytic domain-containing protein
MITIHRIFEIYGLDPNNVRLVRHGNKEIPIYKTFKENISRLEVYQSFQRPKKFGTANSIAVFAPYHKTTALFLGLWEIDGCIENSKFTKKILLELKKYELPESWYKRSDRYKLKRNVAFDELSERLVIEWGASTVSWVQSKDKKVVELKGIKSIGEFQSFGQILLDFHDLKKLAEFSDTSITWVKALSSVNGVYLIKDKTTGKLYVGSAYGEKGIYGRWAAYAKNGHGGNIELRDLESSNFQFSILEIVSATTTAEGVINCENKWKEKLGTRQFGLNKN